MLQHWFEFKEKQNNKMSCTKKTIIWRSLHLKSPSRPESRFPHLQYQLQTNVLTYYGLINSIPQEYKKALKRTGVQQEHLTQPWENLKVLTTKAIHKSFVKHMFEEPTTKQRLIADGLPPDRIGKYFNLNFESLFSSVN